MSEQVEKLSAPVMVNPEQEHNAWENIHYPNNHLLSWLLSVLGSATRAISGSVSAGQIVGLKVLFNLADGTRKVISFADTAVTVGDVRKIYYADYATETIVSIDLPGFEDFTPDETQFPIVHVVRYQDTPVATADHLEWIAPKTDIYAHVPIGKIIAVHPYAPTPDSYFFKFCDGTGQLGDNFPGHETDLVPNLTDNRFLMGGTAYGVGGSNVLLDHTHTCGGQSNSHYHPVNPPKATSSSDYHYHYIARTNSARSSYQIIGATKHLYRAFPASGDHAYTLCGGSSTPNCGETSTNSHSHTVDIASFNSGHQSASHNHAIGRGSVPGSTSSLPQYFKALFFLRKQQWHLKNRLVRGQNTITQSSIASIMAKMP